MDKDRASLMDSSCDVVSKGSGWEEEKGKGKEGRTKVRQRPILFRRRPQVELESKTMDERREAGCSRGRGIEPAAELLRQAASLVLTAAAS